MDDFWDIDWSYLPDRAFQKIQRIVMSAKADTVPLGGKYYGQFRVNDICYNVIVGHLPSESFRLADDELVLGCMAFGPHDPSSLFADFSVVPDAAIDYIHEGSFLGRGGKSSYRTAEHQPPARCYVPRHEFLGQAGCRWRQP